MSLRPLLTVLIVSVLGLSACGGGEDSASQSDTTVPAPTTTTAPDPAVDKRRAEAMVLKEGDLPPEWKTEPADPAQDALSQEFEKRVYACFGQTENPDEITAEVEGPDLGKGEQSVGSTVVAVKNTALARRDLENIRNTGSYPCVATAIDDYLKKSAFAGIPGVQIDSKVDALSGVDAGPDSFSLRMTSTVSGAGGALSVYVDILGFLADRYQATVVVASPATVPDPAFETASVAKMREKVTANLTA